MLVNRNPVGDLRVESRRADGSEVFAILQSTLYLNLWFERFGKHAGRQIAVPQLNRQPRARRHARTSNAGTQG